MTFVDTLKHAWQRNDSLVCVGLDPEPARFPRTCATARRDLRILPRDRRRHRRSRLLLQAADRALRRARAPKTRWNA